MGRMPAIVSEQNLGPLLCRQRAPVTGVQREAAIYQPIWKSFNVLTMGLPFRCVPLNQHHTDTQMKDPSLASHFASLIQVAPLSTLPNGHPRNVHPRRALAGSMAAQAKDLLYKNTPSLSALTARKPQSCPQNTAVGAQTQHNFDC